MFELVFTPQADADLQELEDNHCRGRAERRFSKLTRSKKLPGPTGSSGIMAQRRK